MPDSARPAARRQPPPPIPLVLLTGFLGAGKTTLLNRLVASPALAGAVVIVNEFGDVPIDHLLVETADTALLTLSSGCLCCTVRGDLVATLEDLLRRRDNGRMPPFDRVVIETTGLADPGPVLNVVALHPYLALRFQVEAVVTVVDAVHGARTLDRFPEAVRQVAMADTLLLGKTDLVGADELDPLRSRLGGLNPTATAMDAASASPEALLRASPPRSRPVPAVLPDDGHRHESGDGDHAGHAHGPHDGQVGSLVLAAAAPLAPAAIELFIALLQARHGSSLLRVKGVVALADDPARPLLVQMVQHTLHPLRRLASWPDGDRSTRLVVIGLGLDIRAISSLWASLTAGPAVDRPDAAALAMSLPDGRGLF